MKPKIILRLGLALVLSGALFGCSTIARYQVEPVSVPEIKIIFARRQIPPAGDLPDDARYPPGFNSNLYGALTNIVAGRISALTVTWADRRTYTGR